MDVLAHAHDGDAELEGDPHEASQMIATSGPKTSAMMPAQTLWVND